MTSLSRLALRDLSRHKLQSLLAILGIALGVGVMLAIDLASETALRALEWSTTTITGQATHRVYGPPGVLTVEAWAQLRNSNPGLTMTPVLLKDIVVEIDGAPKRFQLMGVDPLSERAFRTWSTPDLEAGAAKTLRLFTETPAGILISPTFFSKRLEWKSPLGNQQLQPVGVLQSDSPMDRPYLEQLIIADLASTVKLLGSQQITSIDLKLTDSEKNELEKNLPVGLWLEEANQQRYAARQLLQSFRANLKALSFLSLIVGLLLIFSTMSFSVSRRVQRFGILRTLGVTRIELRDLILLESWVVGFVGSLLGLVLGKVLSSVMTHFVLQTINDLYFSVHISRIPEPPQKYVEGLAIGCLCTLLATWWPARMAMRTTPRMNFYTGPSSESSISKRSQLFLGFGFLLTALACVAFSKTQILNPMVVAFATLLAFLLGATILCVPLAKVLIDALARLTRVIPIFDLHLAVRTLQRILPRLSLAIVSLIAAFSVTVGMDIMIGSFRMNVLDWLMTALKADVYVAPKSFSGTRFEDEIPASVLAQIQKSPEVQGVSLTKHQVLQVDRLQSDGTSNSTRIHWVSIRSTPQTQASYKTLNLRPQDAWQKLSRSKSVIASEVLASRIGLRLNEVVRVHTKSGIQSYTVIDFFNDYGSPQGIFIGGWDRELLPSADPSLDTATTAFVFLTDEGLTKSEDVIARWAKDSEDIRFQSNTDLRKGSIAIFDRTFTVTRIMRLLALLIACAALTSALSSAHLDRIQSIAVQRTLGFSSLQLTISFLVQSATLGLVAAFLAIPTGIGVSWILVHVVNDVSFGWRIDWRLDTASYTGLFFWVLAASWLATLLPIWRCLRTQPSAIMKGDT